ncbi:MAG: peptidyl-prolyl cis-trans isomerase [Suipraeoptans sp.]
MKTKVVTLLLVAALMLSVVTGCTGVDSDTTIIKMGDSKVTADVANFYLRYTQAQWETYYAAYLGEDMWTTEMSEGQTYQEYVKESVITQLEQMVVSKEHMEEYGVEITDEEKAAITEAAKTFLDENDDNVEEKVDASQDVIEEVLTLITLQNKMYTAIGDTADTEVSDDDAAQKSMDYVMLSFTTTDDEGNQTELTDDEKEALKTQASDFQAGAANAKDFSEYATEEGLEANTVTFDSESTSPNEELVAAADVLKEGEVTDVIETDTGLFVGKVTSLFDEDATEAKKQSIISERKDTLYNETVEGWIDDLSPEIDEKAWGKLNFDKLSISI